jgi:hypothetical protein
VLTIHWLQNCDRILYYEFTTHQYIFYYNLFTVTETKKTPLVVECMEFIHDIVFASVRYAQRRRAAPNLTARGEISAAVVHLPR